MQPEKAAKMFVQWHKWRQSFVPSGSIAESEVADELEQRKIYLQGLTKNGYSLMIAVGSKHKPTKDYTQYKSKLFDHLCFYVCVDINNSEMFLPCAEFLVHLLDKTLAG